MGPRVKDHNPLSTQKIVSLKFEKEGAVRETQTFKTKYYILLNRCNIADILLKRRKIYDSIKQEYGKLESVT
jgi:hypothetical protein